MNDFTKVLDALNMADGLMISDTATFKRGYSRESAELSVIEYFKLEGDAVESFRRIMTQKYGAAR